MANPAKKWKEELKQGSFQSESKYDQLSPWIQNAKSQSRTGLEDVKHFTLQEQLDHNNYINIAKSNLNKMQSGKLFLKICFRVQMQ